MGIVHPEMKGKPSRRAKMQDVFLRQHEKLAGLSVLKKIPFVTRLNFAPLLRFWEQKLQSNDAAERILAAEIMKRAKKAPELWEPVDDLERLEHHRETLELLLTGMFPAYLRETQLGRVTKPFDQTAFYLTPALEKMLADRQIKTSIHQRKEGHPDIDAIRACLAILQQCYGQTLDVEQEIIFTSVSERDGIECHFKTDFNARFIEVKPLKPLKKLTKPQVSRLFDNIYDLDTWLEALPPESFEIHGVTGMQLVDVTSEEALSRLRTLLLKKEAFSEEQNIALLEKLIKSWLKLPGLRTGILMLSYQPELKEKLTCSICHGILQSKNHPFSGKEHPSVYEKACFYGEMVITESFRKMEKTTSVEKSLAKQGIKSHIAAPLFNHAGEVIGLLELGAPEEYALNSFTAAKLQEILPQFSRALQRRQEETDNRIERVLREKFTTIHPSVEWRFVQSAKRFLDKLDAKGKANIEPILFKDIYPLYAQSDIVNSSLTRNHAIRQDFITNLNLVLTVLKIAHRRLDLPLLGRLVRQTEQHAERLSANMLSTDEPFFMDFILREIHPLLSEVATKDPLVNLAVQRYFSKLDPVLGLVYDKRKAYEDSVNLINGALSDYVDQEDERAQKMIPHYFEKYQTDGVQFELYAGQSLLERGTFSQFQLHNLRLWQFIAMCEITRRMEALKKEMPMPLETAALIFVYGQPIAVRFRMDEKFFDVDGAYNIRYEIIKKRIDKALLLGTEERLTQTGKIAIVYSGDIERELYLGFCAHLIAEGYLSEDIEELELENLQETQGLKALRVTVLMGAT